MHNDRIEELNLYLKKQKLREEKKSKGIVTDSESDEEIPFIPQKATENLADT